MKNNPTHKYHGYFDQEGKPQVERIGITGRKSKLPPCNKLFNHSPDGFAWGYGGSGPAQLALALAYDVLRDKEKAVEVHQDLKFRIIGSLAREEEWTMERRTVEKAIEAIEGRKQANI